MRDDLHNLIDRLRDGELPAAQRYLEFLTIAPAYRAALAAPIDEEPVTEEDEIAIMKAQSEVESGRTVSHEEILREFDLR